MKLYLEFQILSLGNILHLVPLIGVVFKLLIYSCFISVLGNFIQNLSIFFLTGTHRQHPRGVRPDLAAEAIGAVRRLRQVHRPPDPAEIQRVPTSQLLVLSLTTSLL